MRAVLERDLVAEGSRKRAFVARTLVGAVAAAVAFAAATAGARGAPTDTAGAAAFAFLSRALLVFLAVATPALLVASVLGERRQHTLGLLLASPVTVRGILLGKLVARGGTAALWAAAALPPLGVLILLGGTSALHLGNAAAALLGATVELAALGLLVSCAARGMATGIVLSYLLPLGHWFGAFTLPRGFLSGTPAAVLAGTSPLAGLAPPDEWPTGLAWGPGPGFAYLGFALLLGVAALALAARLLAGEEEREARLAPRPPRIGEEDRLRRWITRDNPVAWKESLLLDAAWSRFLYYLLLGLMVAGEIACVWLDRSGRWEPDTNDAWIAGCFTALAALAAVLAAASMAHEKSRGTLDILRTTPLTARRIVNGKLGGAAAGMILLLVAPVGHLGLSWLRGWISFPEAAGLLLVGLLFVANFGVHGLAWGTVARTPLAAILGGASMIVLGSIHCYGLCLLGPILLLLSFSFSLQERTGGTPQRLVEILMLPAVLGGSPLFALLVLPRLLPGGPDRSWSAVSGLVPMAVFSLVATPVFLITRYGALPGMLQRELVEMTRGEGVRPPMVIPRRRWLPSWLRRTDGGKGS